MRVAIETGRSRTMRRARHVDAPVIRHLWTLEKSGQRISFLLVDHAVGFELQLAWSDGTNRSSHTFPTRSAAMGEAERQLRMWIANDWRPVC